MSFEIIGPEAEKLMGWKGLCEAIAHAHSLPKAQIADSFLYRDKDTLLSRCAWIDGLGLATKAATVFPNNPANNLPVVNGAVNLFCDDTGQLEALIDFHLVTKWKTAGDSLLAALHLARPDSRKILIIGAGTVGHALRDAYGAGFPDARFQIWNRTADAASKMAKKFSNTSAVSDLEAAVREADIITSATMATEPLIKGAWLQAGQHVDLIGAYRADMREADDAALARSKLFVDSRDTTLDHIGEMMIPLASGAISRGDILADFYDLGTGKFTRQNEADITLFKNGGGAHLDLMVSRYVLDVWRRKSGV